MFWVHGGMRIELPGLAGETMTPLNGKTDTEKLSRVIVFTRYPEPGKTKTRMIPALGSEGAAKLHVALTRHTLHVAEDYCGQQSCELEVRFAGGDAARMSDLFGSDQRYRPQTGDDLGERLINAISVALTEQASRVVVIGSDCPDIDATILGEAMRALSDCDVALGPAIDGGYYLIGLRENQPQLFQDIDWGSDQVLKQTLDKAGQSHLRVHCLRPLSDVDYPEDLTVCQRYPEAFAELLTDQLL